MRLVRFTARLSPYNPGDQAGFPDGRARELVNSGVAEFVDGEARAARPGAALAPEAPQFASEDGKVMTGAQTKVLDAPPADRMITRDDAEQKDQGRRRRGPQAGTKPAERGPAEG